MDDTCFYITETLWSIELLLVVDCFVHYSWWACNKSEGYKMILDIFSSFFVKNLMPSRACCVVAFITNPFSSTRFAINSFVTMFTYKTSFVFNVIFNNGKYVFNDVFKKIFHKWKISKNRKDVKKWGKSRQWKHL